MPSQVAEEGFPYRAVRKKLGISPAEMATAMGVPYDSYKSWQSGRCAMPAVAVRCVELLSMYPKTDATTILTHNGIQLSATSFD